jgi:hypothetical protein
MDNYGFIFKSNKPVLYFYFRYISSTIYLIPMQSDSCDTNGDGDGGHAPPGRATPAAKDAIRKTLRDVIRSFHAKYITIEKV